MGETKPDNCITQEIATSVIETLMHRNFISEPHLDVIQDDYGFFDQFSSGIIDYLFERDLPDDQRIIMLASHSLGLGMHIALCYGPCIEEIFIPDIQQDMQGIDLLELALNDYGIQDTIKKMTAGAIMMALISEIYNQVKEHFPAIDFDRTIIRQFMGVLFDTGLTIVNNLEKTRQALSRT